MPYNPGQTYIGGQLIAGGLQNLGQGIQSAVEEIHKNQQLDAYNDYIAQQALNSQRITHEQYDKYLGLSRQQKTGFIAGINADLTDKWMRNAALTSEAFARGNVMKAQAKALFDLSAGGAGAAPVAHQVLNEKGEPTDQWVYQVPGAKPGSVRSVNFQSGGTEDVYSHDAQGNLLIKTAKGRRPANDTEIFNYNKQQRANAAAAQATAAAAQQQPAAGWNFRRWPWSAGTPPTTAPGSVTRPPTVNQGQRQNAIMWLQKNPNDPRAPAIRAKLGIPAPPTAAAQPAASNPLVPTAAPAAPAGLGVTPVTMTDPNTGQQITMVLPNGSDVDTFLQQNPNYSIAGT